jgi:hypothetical protein
MQTGWGLIICAHQEATSEGGCRVGCGRVGDRGVAAAGCGPAAHATRFHCLSLAETTVSPPVTWNPQMAGWQGPFRPSCPPTEPFQDSHPPRNRWRGADCGWCANPRTRQPPMIRIGPVFSGRQRYLSLARQKLCETRDSAKALRGGWWRAR